MSIRRLIFEIIQPDHGNSVASRVFDLTITALILMSAVIVFAVTFDLPPSVLPVLKWLERTEPKIVSGGQTGVDRGAR